jgi:hypothetical protein
MASPRRHGEKRRATENGKDYVGVLFTTSFSPCSLRVLRVSVVKP